MNIMLHTKHASLSETLYKMWNELMFMNFPVAETKDLDSENIKTEQAQVMEE